jgi:uncharacterized membrane protein YhaH (DUF805 family)
MEWMILPYKRYADFEGRSRRLEYWMFTLFYVIVAMVLLLLAIIPAAGADATGEPTGEMSAVSVIFFVLFGLFVLGSFIPGLAVQVRRFHDQDKSGWLILLNFIPYLGGFIVFIFMCIDGTPGENSYGPSPKGWNNSGVFD